MSAGDPPPYAYGLLDGMRAAAASHESGLVDLSVGNPVDQPPPSALAAERSSWVAPAYPPSAGTERLRTATASWLTRKAGASVARDDVSVCVGTKEFFGTLPWLLSRRRPDRDTVLLPALGYPSYVHGAVFAGLRVVRVPLDGRWRLRLDAIDARDIERSLCLFICSPGNPTGAADDVAAAVQWGRDRGVLVVSDECGIGLSWRDHTGAEVRHGRSALANGPEGLLAVQSLSKWGNFAAGRVGFYSGDRELVEYLTDMRRHLGMLVPTPMQEAAAAVLDDDAGCLRIRETYRRRLDRLAEVMRALGAEVNDPDGGFFLWCRVPGGDAWAFARQMADVHGLVVAPGSLYGDGGEAHVRVGAVLTDTDLEALAGRVGA